MPTTGPRATAQTADPETLVVDQRHCDGRAWKTSDLAQDVAAFFAASRALQETMGNRRFDHVFTVVLLDISKTTCELKQPIL